MVAHPYCIEQGATILTDSTVDFEWRRPLRAGIESQAGPNCSGTGSKEKKLAEWQLGPAVSISAVVVADCFVH
jgi:hypothetical protein